MSGIKRGNLKFCHDQIQKRKRKSDKKKQEMNICSSICSKIFRKETFFILWMSVLVWLSWNHGPSVQGSYLVIEQKMKMTFTSPALQLIRWKGEACRLDPTLQLCRGTRKKNSFISCQCFFCEDPSGFYQSLSLQRQLEEALLGQSKSSSCSTCRRNVEHKTPRPNT